MDHFQRNRHVLMGNHLNRAYPPAPSTRLCFAKNFEESSHPIPNTNLQYNVPVILIINKTTTKLSREALFIVIEHELDPN